MRNRSVLFGACAVITVSVFAACQSEVADTNRDSSPPLSDGCWTLEYGEATAGLPSAEGVGLPPTTIRIWTDSTFPNSEGLVQVEAAPRSDGSGGGMMSRISDTPDSVELTWATAMSSTHYRLEVFSDSMSGTAWHHGETDSASHDPRRVRARPVPCPVGR